MVISFYMVRRDIGAPKLGIGKGNPMKIDTQE